MRPDLTRRALPRRGATTLVLLAAALGACTSAGPEDGTGPSPVPTTTAEPAPDTTAPTAPAVPSTPAAPSPDDTAAAAARPVDGPFAADILAAGEFASPVRFEVALRDAESPAELVEVIIASEEAVRDESLSEDARAVAAHRAQRAYRLLGRTPAWRDQVLGALPDRWRPIAEGNIAARDALNRLRTSGDPPTEMPAWEIVEPEPADALLSYYREAQEQLGVDWELLAAINLVETRMGRIVGFSTAQARGPMQFIPESWEIFGNGGDIDDARDSIMAAARHLTGRPGNPPSERNALLHYNRSSDYGDAVLAITDVLRQDPTAYHAYHGWQVYYSTPEHEFLLPVGYRETERVPIEQYLQREAIEVVG